MFVPRTECQESSDYSMIKEWPFLNSSIREWHWNWLIPVVFAEEVEGMTWAEHSDNSQHHLPEVIPPSQLYSPQSEKFPKNPKDRVLKLPLTTRSWFKYLLWVLGDRLSSGPDSMRPSPRQGQQGATLNALLTLPRPRPQSLISQSAFEQTQWVGVIGSKCFIRLNFQALHFF